MNRKLFLALMLTVSMTVAEAQETTVKDNGAQSTYEMAEKNFNLGYFDKAERELVSVVKSLKGMHKVGAYRLLAMCQLETGDEEGAKQYVALLLKTDPYYTPTLNDPQRLVDMILEAKSQSAGITTASRQAESVEEAPVPVTLITEDMIRYSGASTLQELLCMFVPGMTSIEGVEANIAMHGIYGMSQEKILFLQDGHRLNGSSTNAEAPDYRNSLDKIQQIEVLRGPASSLYGNVALTAVVNIITKKGAVLDGGRVSGTLGTQNTFGGSFVIGGGNNVVDVVGWGSVNSTDGFKHVIPNALGGTTTLYSNAYNNRPAYDMGIKARWGDFSMTINSQRAKKTPYVNIMQLPATQDLVTNGNVTYIVPLTDDYDMVQNYNVDRYQMVGSNGPGITRTNHHINVDYVHSFGNIDFSASGYVSLEHTSLYNVLGDSIAYNIGALMLQSIQSSSTSSSTYSGMDDATQRALLKMYVKTKGVFEVLEWENITIGGQAQILTKYGSASSPTTLGWGSAVFGAQYEHFALTNGTLFLGGNYSTEQMVSSGSVFNDDMEDVLSAYAQLKHYFSTRFIMNAGLRFDHKNRFSGEKLNRFSPRVSFIYKFSNALSARGSYNYSFVDAPYIYRACAVTIFSGGKDLQPETMGSFMLGLTYHKPGSHLSAELAGFYNSISDLVTQDIASSNGYLFHNAGRVKQTGVDGSVQYNSGKLFFNGNITWQRVLSSEGYNVYNGNRLGIPQFSGNMMASWLIYSGKGTGLFRSGKLRLNGNVRAQSSTKYQALDVLSTYAKKDFHGEVKDVAAQVVLGVGATYEWKYLDVNVMVKNLTDNEYMVGSVLSDGIPYSGRQILGNVTIKF